MRLRSTTSRETSCKPRARAVPDWAAARRLCAASSLSPKATASGRSAACKLWPVARRVSSEKAPKLIWFDSGVQRALSGEIGGLRGEQYESALTAQILMTL